MVGMHLFLPLGARPGAPIVLTRDFPLAVDLPDSKEFLHYPEAGLRGALSARARRNRRVGQAKRAHPPTPRASAEARRAATSLLGVSKGRFCAPCNSTRAIEVRDKTSLSPTRTECSAIRSFGASLP